jgi:hypothetical protein
VTPDEEVRSALLSLRLCVEFNKDKPNKAIRYTCNQLRKRLTSLKALHMVYDIQCNYYPLGELVRYE